MHLIKSCFWNNVEGRGGAAGKRNPGARFGPSRAAEGWEGAALPTDPSGAAQQSSFQPKETAAPGRGSVPTHPRSKETVLDTQGPSQLEKT